MINNGGEQTKERIVSRNNIKNSNLIAGSNTLNFGQTNKIKGNNNPKSSLLVNTHFYSNNNKNNGAEIKSKDYYNKNAKEEEKIVKSDKLSLISSIAMKSSERFDINKTVNKVNHQASLFKKIEQAKSKSK